jgi:serine/threonine protein kinase
LVKRKREEKKKSFSSHAHKFPFSVRDTKNGLRISLRQKNGEVMHSIITRRPDGSVSTDRSGKGDEIVAPTVQALLVDLQILPRSQYTAPSGPAMLNFLPVPVPGTIALPPPPMLTGNVSAPANPRRRSAEMMPPPPSASDTFAFSPPTDRRDAGRSRAQTESQRRGDPRDDQPVVVNGKVQYDTMLPRDRSANTSRAGSAAATAAAGQTALNKDGLLEIQSRAAPVRIDTKNREVPISTSQRAVVLRGKWSFENDCYKLVEPWLEEPNATWVRVAVKQVTRPIKTKALVAWSKLRHAHVLPLFGLWVQSSLRAQRIVMPLVSNGSLRELLDRTDEADLTERMQLRVMQNVAAAVLYLHEHNVIHRDLAAHNVMLHRYRNDDQLTALLAGFSLTREVEEDAIYESANFFDVPLQPLAPEQLVDFCQQLSVGCRSTAATDVWAFGVLAAELLLPHVKDFYAPLTADLPSNEKRKWMEAVHDYVAVSYFTPLDLYVEDLATASPALVGIARICLQHNVGARPSINQIDRQLTDMLARKAAAPSRSSRASARDDIPAPASPPTPKRAASQQAAPQREERRDERREERREERRDDRRDDRRDERSSPATERRDEAQRRNESPQAGFAADTMAFDASYDTSEMARLQREWVELEREFAIDMVALESYHSELSAQAFMDPPVMGMFDVETMFKGVTKLTRGANAFHQALASANRDASFAQTAAKALKETNLPKLLTEFLANELKAQQMLSERMTRPAKGKELIRNYELFTRWHSNARAKPKMRGQSLFELFAVPGRHAQAQKRMIARLEAGGGGDTMSSMRKDIDGVSNPSAKESSELNGANVLAELKWSSTVYNDFGGRSNGTITGAQLLMTSPVGLELPGKKATQNTLLLFSTGLLICDKKRVNVVVAVDLSPINLVQADPRGTTGFRLLVVSRMTGASFQAEVSCVVRCDALQICDAIRDQTIKLNPRGIGQ